MLGFFVLWLVSDELFVVCVYCVVMLVLLDVVLFIVVGVGVFFYLLFSVWIRLMVDIVCVFVNWFVCNCDCSIECLLLIMLRYVILFF